MNLSKIGPVALIGAGKMGMALAQGWLASGINAGSLVLADPKPSAFARDFADRNGLQLLSEIGGRTADIVILAVKPQIMPPVMAELRPTITPATLVISIAAGVPIAKLAEGLRTQRIIRTMPNTPAQVGKGITGAVAGFEATAAERDATESLLKAAGEVVWFSDEAKLDAVTAVSGSGPAYVFNFVEALAAAAERQGLDADQAMKLARQTVIGAAALLEADPAPASVLRENVTSPNGTTAAALAVLMGQEGLAPLLDRAVDAARRRSEELGRG